MLLFLTVVLMTALRLNGKYLLLVEVEMLEDPYSRNHHVGYTRDATLCSTTLMFTVTLLTSSFISVTLTIHNPVLLNGTRISRRG